MLLDAAPERSVLPFLVAQSVAAARLRFYENRQTTADAHNERIFLAPFLLRPVDALFEGHDSAILHP